MIYEEPENIIYKEERRLQELSRKYPHENFDREYKYLQMMIADLIAEYKEEEESVKYIAIATIDDYDETERRIKEYRANENRKRAFEYQIRRRLKAKYMSILRERLRERLRIKALKASIIQQQKEIEQRNKLIKKRYGIYK